MNVVALSGPRGAGKSTLLRKIEGEYCVQHEDFRAMNRHSCDNGSVLSKWLYIGSWFDKILQAQVDQVSLLVADRSPIDTAAYAAQGSELLLPAVLRSFVEIRERGIEIKSLLITASFEALSTRLDVRRELEPHRSGDLETESGYEQRALLFYRSHPGLWAGRLDTTNRDEQDCADELRHLLKGFT